MTNCLSVSVLVVTNGRTVLPSHKFVGHSQCTTSLETNDNHNHYNK